MATTQPAPSLTDKIMAIRGKEVQQQRKTFNKKYKRRHAKLVEQLEAAVAATCAHLLKARTYDDAEIIRILDPTILVTAHHETGTHYETELSLASEFVAAWLYGDIGIVPDLGQLVIATANPTPDEDTDEYWTVVYPDTLLDNVGFDEFESGTFESDRVQPLLDWLEDLQELE